jgi:serine protease AprX
VYLVSGKSRNFAAQTFDTSPVKLARTVKIRRRVVTLATVVSVALGVAAAGASADTASNCAITTSPNFDPTTQVVNNPHSMYNAILASGARTYYAGGYFGQGVDVAVIDTGVAPVPGLTDGNVINGPDLSFESNNPAVAHNDTFGHGTHMASIIAGREAGWNWNDYLNPAKFQGIAPGARVVSVKVGDSMGAVDVTQIIAGIDWVVTHRRDPGMNIRVISLSLGLHAKDAYQNDALAFAVQQAWKNGIVVVAAAGNEGMQQSDGSMTGLLSPAYDADMIAVTSYDTVTNKISPFAQATNNNLPPSFAAPGQSVQGLRAPGSYEDTEVLAECADAMAKTGTWTQPIWGPSGRFINGSGTSQATAMAAGAAALILSKQPNLNPDQVKLWLEASSTRMPYSASTSQPPGWGAMNLTAAYSFSTSFGLSHNYVTGGNGVDLARGDSILVDQSTGIALTGWQDWFGSPFIPAGNNGSVQNDEPKGSAWKPVKDASGKIVGESWNGHWLTGSGFVSDPVLGSVWQGHTWSGTDWSGHTWSGHTWSGHTWSGNRWTGGDWASDSFTGHTWSGHTWGDFSWS